MSGAEPHRPYRNPAKPQRPLQGGAAPKLQSEGQFPHPVHGQCRPGRSDEVHLESLGADLFMQLTLALLRLHFQTFAAPETQGWLTALRCATTHVGPRAAGPLCYDLVALVQALRTARVSPVRFNPESCACCRVWLTPEERQLMELLAALRRGRIGRARALVQMLCDGAPSDDLIAMAGIYLRRHAPDVLPPAGDAPAPTKGE